MQQLLKIKQWYYSLPTKEQWMVSGTSALLLITLFYLIIWEPLHLGLEEEQQKKHSQQEILLWMQQAANEVKTLRTSGSSSTIRDKNKPTTLVIEQAIKNAGLNPSVKKIESSGSNGASGRSEIESSISNSASASPKALVSRVPKSTD